MKQIDCTTTVKDYTEQIDWIESILSNLEDLQSLYFKGQNFCSDDYKDVTSQIEYWKELQQQLEQERQELIEKTVRSNERLIQLMNYEFERSRL